MAIFSGRDAYELVVDAGAFRTYPESNQTEIYIRLIARVRSGYSNPGTWSSDPIGTYSLSVDGQGWSGSWTPDFRNTNSITLLNDGKIVTHNADGAKTVTFSFSANANNSIGSAPANGSDSVNLILPDYTRLPLAPGAPSLSRSQDGSAIGITSQFADGRGLIVTDYNWRFSTDNTSWSGAQAMGTGRVATLGPSGVTTTQTYWVQTRGYTSEGWGEWSASTSIGGVALPPASISTSRTGRNVTVTAGASPTAGVNGYYVQASSNNGSTWGAAQLMTGQSYTYQNLQPALTYIFRVYATNPIGYSANTTSSGVFIPAGGKIRIGSQWVNTAAMRTRINSGPWTDAANIRVRRGSSWVDTV